MGHEARTVTEVVPSVRLVTPGNPLSITPNEDPPTRDVTHGYVFASAVGNREPIGAIKDTPASRGRSS
ncbi:unnamed protein product [Arctogadus glacialis]